MKSSVQWSILLLIKFRLLLVSCHYSTPLCALLWKSKSLRKCPAVFDPIDYTVHGSLQARILEWVAFPFSGGSSQPRDRTQVSHIVSGFFTSWATWEAQEHWSGYPNPSPGYHSNSGIELGFPVLQADSLPAEPQGKPWCPCYVSFPQ